MPAALPTDPNALLRSREYRVLLVFAAIVGIVVSAASWSFLELVHALQTGIYEDLPGQLGFDETPVWWPLPWLALAGVLTAFAIERLPGSAGHVPAEGLKTGGAPTQPVELPGVLLAALATLGFGLVLGPEGPLIALGAGLGVFALRRARADAPDQALALLAAAGSFAAVATIFGSPVIGAVLIIEATGIGGAMLPLVLLPGLLSAGIGSLVFIGLGSGTGLSTAAWQLAPFPLPAYGGPGWGDFGWTLVLSVGIAVVVFGVMEVGRWTARAVEGRRLVVTVAAGLAVGVLAILFDLVADGPENAVLFSGQEAFGDLFVAAPTLGTSTLVALFVFKAAAWGLSLGAFRGGPTFPAIFLGVVAGLALADLPGYGETPAIAALVGAACVSVLRLPLSSVMIALLLCVENGFEVAPLVIVGVVAAYIASLTLSAHVDRRIGATPAVAVSPPTR
jgi:H+/Cl- antiporter ClcA